MNFEPGWGRWKTLPAALSHGGTDPRRPPWRAAWAQVDLSSSRSQVFDCQIRQSTGTDHGFEKFDSGRAELVVSRITTTISIARQGPSAFFISAGGPAHCAARILAWGKSSAKTILRAADPVCRH
jgi:hypothetical protein